MSNNWTLRVFFDGMRIAQIKYTGDDNVTLERKQQDQLCDLVERFYKPYIPSVDDMLSELDRRGWEINKEGSTGNIIIELHNWLTEINTHH